MKHLFKKLSLTLVGLLLAGNLIAVPVMAQDTKESVCQGIGLAGGTEGCEQPTDAPSVNDAIRTAINLLSYFIGVVAVIMIIIGGFKYVTSSGDSNGINSAKNTILYALIGLVIVALAQVIVRYVLRSVE